MSRDIRYTAYESSGILSVSDDPYQKQRPAKCQTEDEWTSQVSILHDFLSRILGGVQHGHRLKRHKPYQHMNSHISEMETALRVQFVDYYQPFKYSHVRVYELSRVHIRE